MSEDFEKMYEDVSRQCFRQTVWLDQLHETLCQLNSCVVQEREMGHYEANLNFVVKEALVILHRRIEEEAKHEALSRGKSGGLRSERKRL